MAFVSTIMGDSTRVAGTKISDTVWVMSVLDQVTHTLGSMPTAKARVMASTSGRTATNMKGSSVRVSSMAMGCGPHPKVKLTRESGKRISRTDMVFTHGRTEIDTRVNGVSPKNMGRVKTLTRMATFT